MKTVKLMVAALAVLFAGGARAQAIEITTDTVVGPDDVSTYAAATEIDIAEGASLVFQELTADVTFVATLTGGGNFVVVHSSTANGTRVTLNGDATAFTGGFFITNMLFTATGPNAVGTAPLKLYLGKDKTKSYLNGTGVYQCPVDLWCGSGSTGGFYITKDVELAAPLYFRNGRIQGPGKITGKVTIAAKTAYISGNVHIAGGMGMDCEPGDNVGTVATDGFNFYLDAPIDLLKQMNAGKGTIFFGCDNAVVSGTPMVLGMQAAPYGVFDLLGHDQIFASLAYAKAPSTDEIKKLSSLTSTDGPATLTLPDRSTAFTYYGQIDGELSLCVAGTNPFTLSGLLDSTTTGALIASNGLMVVSAGTSFSNLSGLQVKGTGKLTVNTSAVSPDQVDVELFDEGVLEIADGVTVAANHVIVNGTYLTPGSYTKDSEAVKDRVIGDGTLTVLNGEPVIEGKTYTWVGGTAGDALSEPLNWKEGEAPQFNGTERLVFGEGSAQAVVSGEVSVYAIEIVTNAAFTLTAADDSAKILLGDGGLLVSNAVDDAKVTHVLACPVKLVTLPQSWTIAAGTTLEDAAPLSSDPTEAQFTINSAGGVQFHADNSGLEAPMVLTGFVDNDSQPFVNHRYGLGSTNRFTTLYCGWPRFEGLDKGDFTNATPLRVCGTGSDKLRYIINTNYKSHSWQEGEVRIFGTDQCVFYIKGYFHFTGGITVEDGAVVTGSLNERDVFFTQKPIVSAGKLSVLGTVPLHLDVAGNHWSSLAVVKTRVVCGVENALDPLSPIEFGSTNWAEDFGGIDLNGIDQACSRIVRQWNPFSTSKPWDTCYVTLTSASPAVLEVTSSVTDSVPIKVEGMAGVRFNGVGRLAFTNFVCSTTGTLEVARGTVKMELGASWANTTNVVVGADGRLELDAGTADTAFGPSAGSSAAVLRVAEGGRLSIAADETATVRAAATVVDGEDKFLEPGTYGGEGAGLDAAHTLPWIEGGGSLTVLKYGGKSGVMIIIR